MFELDETTRPTGSTSARSSTYVVASFNTNHRKSIEDILNVYGDVVIDNKLKNIKLRDVELDSFTIVFNHHDIEAEVLKPISFDKKCNDFSEAEATLMDMAKEAAEKRGYSHIQVQEVLYPETYVELGLTFAFITLCFGRYFPNIVYDMFLNRTLPFPNHWIAAIKPYNDVILFTTITLHAIEAATLMVPRLLRYRVPPDYQLEWLFLCTIQGIFSIKQFDRVVKRLKEQENKPKEQ